MSHDTVPGRSIIGEGLQADREYKVKVYDFKRPDKFSKEQIRTVTIMHETFGRLSSTSLSAQLRQHVDVHCAAVDQMTFGEFMASIPDPTMMAIVRMTPLKGTALLEIDPQLTFGFIDRLFGGRGIPEDLHRDYSNLEISVLEGLITRLLGNLEESWSTVIDLAPSLGQIESNPQFALIVPPNEMIVLVTMEVTMAGKKGMINFCIPYLTIEPIVPKLGAMYWYSRVRKGSRPLNQMDAARGVKIRSAVYFRGAKIPLRELGSLERGSLVPLPEFAEGKAYLEMGGTTVAGLIREKRERKKPLRFSIERGTDAFAGGLSLLTPRQRGERAVPAEAGTAATMSDEIRASIKELAGRIGEMSRRQDEIVDEMLFAAPGRNVPEGGGSEPFRRPFSFITSDDRDFLALFLQSEHPQTAALILSYLESSTAAAVLATLDDARQADVAWRIAAIDRTVPEVLQTVERILQKKLNVGSSEKALRAGGIDSLVEILNVVPRSVEKNVGCLSNYIM